MLSFFAGGFLRIRLKGWRGERDHSAGGGIVLDGDSTLSAGTVDADAHLIDRHS